MSATKYTIGLDYGTNSVRTLIVNVANGREVASAVWNYEHGTQGVILARDPNLARQHPADYVKGAEVTIKKALGLAKRAVRGFAPEQIIGIGVDTTGSTPLPVDGHGRPLAFAYNYHCRGRIDGLRAGAGTLLLAGAIEESFRHGDRVYDLGVGSLACKRYLATAVAPIYRYSYFPPGDLRTQLLRLKRSWQAWRMRGPVAPRPA